MTLGSNQPPETANDRLRRNVKALMDWRRMTQAQLAERLGQSQPWLSKRLTGTTPFQIEDLDLLANAFSLSPQDLFCEGHGEFERRTGEERRSGTDRRTRRDPFPHTGMTQRPTTTSDTDDPLPS